jgi:hypothetical protein
MTIKASTARPRKTAAKTPQDRKPSLRDQLKSKQPHTTSRSFPVGEAGEKAKAALDQARESLSLLNVLNSQRNGRGKVDAAAAEAAVKRAQAAYEKVSVTLTFRGLSPVELDALANEFDVPELSPEELAELKEKGQKPPEFDVRGYTGALMALAVIDSDLSADEWDEELYESGRWSDGEVYDIREAARSASKEGLGPGIPKG